MAFLRALNPANPARAVPNRIAAAGMGTAAISMSTTPPSACVAKASVYSPDNPAKLSS